MCGDIEKIHGTHDGDSMTATKVTPWNERSILDTSSAAPPQCVSLDRHAGYDSLSIALPSSL
jgi:hypothetical protein